jgi:NAD(P)-dependent dehydrogenase (short-subunit alcohol dehydrogenase family)
MGAMKATRDPVVDPKVAVVTGGAGGLGASIARRLGGAGYRLIITYRGSRTEARRLEAEFRGTGVDVTTAELDLEDLAAVADFGRGVASSCPAVHGLVNCAGRLHRGGVRATPPEELVRSFAINCAAPVILTRAIVDSLRAAQGAVVNVSSLTANVAGQDRIAYTASKAALVGVTRALAVELAPEVRVNSVLPGLFDTRMNSALKDDRLRYSETLRRTPAGRLGRPDELASVVEFLLGDGATYITGAALPVDGGVTARTPLPAGDPPEA